MRREDRYTIQNIFTIVDIVAQGLNIGQQAIDTCSAVAATSLVTIRIARSKMALTKVFLSIIPSIAKTFVATGAFN